MAEKSDKQTPSDKPVGSAPHGSETDWRKLAIRCRLRLEWILANMRPPPGTGLMLNRDTGKTFPWQDPIMDLIDEFPGCKIDREAVYACQLPRKERNKWFEKHRKPTSQNAEVSHAAPPAASNPETVQRGGVALH